MPDFDAAFEALEHLDDKGRLALRVSGQMYEELYLAADARAERAEGDWLLLDVPLGFNLTPDTWEEEESEEVFALQSQVHPVWRGFHRPPLIDADGSLREPSAGERASEQKLARLAETAQTISDQIGSEPAAVIVYLLCGEWSGLAYASVRRSPQYGGYVITVRDRRVPIKDITAQYRVYRDLFSLPSRQPQEGPYLVVEFVEKARATERRNLSSRMRRSSLAISEQPPLRRVLSQVC